MRVECPSCRTSYELTDSSIGPKGRKLRCGKCSLVWRTDPAASTPLARPGPTKPEDELSAFEAEFSGNLEADAVEDPGEDEAAAWDAAAAEGWDLDEEADAMSVAFEDVKQDSEADEFSRTMDVPDFDTETGGGEGTGLGLDLLAGLDAEMFASEGIRNVSDGNGDGFPDGPGSGRKKESLTVIEANVASALAEANEMRSIEAVAARQAKHGGKAGKSATRNAMAKKALGFVSLAASIALLVTALTMRSSIVRAVPDLASLYAAVGLHVNLRGLEFRDIRMLRDVSNGSPVFVVEGLIQNVSAKTVRLPTVLFSLRDDAKSELYSWTAQLSLTALAAGETTRFKTELTTAPAIATDILVRFNDSPQRRAGL